eukprot:1158981-Pelagomonas_calceolata.AAC.1
MSADDISCDSHPIRSATRSNHNFHSSSPAALGDSLGAACLRMHALRREGTPGFWRNLTHLLRVGPGCAEGALLSKGYPYVLELC